MKLIPAKLPDIRSFHRDVEVISGAQDYLADLGIYYEQDGQQILEFLIAQSSNEVIYIQQVGDSNWFKISTISPNSLPAEFNQAVEEIEKEIEEDRDRKNKK